MIIKHPMDFSTMKDKITTNDYKTITEFKVRGNMYLLLYLILRVESIHRFESLFSVLFFQADFKLMCDNAMIYNRPETVYYKAAKKLLHTGFKMMSKVMWASWRDCFHI